MFRTRTRAQAPADKDAIAPDVYPTEHDDEALADHGLHVDNETCARCGRDITPMQEARRTAKGDHVHMSC